MNRRHVAGGLLISTLIVLVYAQGVRHERDLMAARVRPYGCLTAQQAIDGAMPILHSLLPAGDSGYVAAETAEERMPEGITHRYWEVNCGSAAGNLMARVVRDADTGAISRVSRLISGPEALGRHTAPPISARQAIRSAQSWLYMLGITARSHQERPPSRTQNCWFVVLNAADLKASLILDAYTSKLVDAHIEPRR
jgi:hypothetical protein